MTAILQLFAMKRNPLWTALFYLMFVLPGSGQVSWFPVGAKWHYQISSMIGGGLTMLEVLKGDTLIANHPYKRILSTTIIQYPAGLDTSTEMLYVYEENQVVFGYDQWSGGTLLYDFTAVVGDTISMYFGGLSPYPFVVDSIGQMDMNGVQLTFQDIRFPGLFEPGEFNTMRVVEGLGSINSHLFHNRTIIQPFDFPSYYFRCYEDVNIGLINLSFNQVECDYIDGVTSTPESAGISTLIFPNPASDFVTIQTGGRSVDKIVVIDVFGSIRIESYPAGQASITIDTRKLENGLFIIMGVDQSNTILFSKKFTKAD